MEEIQQRDSSIGDLTSSHAQLTSSNMELMAVRDQLTNQLTDLTTSLSAQQVRRPSYASMNYIGLDLLFRTRSTAPCLFKSRTSERVYISECLC